MTKRHREFGNRKLQMGAWNLEFLQRDIYLYHRGQYENHLGRLQGSPMTLLSLRAKRGNLLGLLHFVRNFGFSTGVLRNDRRLHSATLQGRAGEYPMGKRVGMVSSKGRN